ncbi:hypothetical protein [Aeromonas hydrophila]|uniref:hypothetical protein n=1 Tax=Aeromonas hydrophila TaxID=644 RepID=UPI002B4A4D53|nr:hypothetical protein [Aeromonas hydrophila]
MRVESRTDQRPLIHFTFNNLASVQKPMSLTLLAVDSTFDTLSLYGVYKDLPSDHELIPHHDIELPRSIDIRFISFPIVIDHPDVLAGMLTKLDSSKLTQEQEQKLLPLRVALKMHEIAELVASKKVSPGNNGMTPIIFKSIDSQTGKPIVGWRFEPESAVVGDLIHYDHGAGINKNTDAMIIWKHPKLPAQLEKLKKSPVSHSEQCLILKEDGDVTLGTFKFNPHFQGGYFSINHNPISEKELSEIKFISSLPSENYLPKHPVSELKVGDKVVAWDNKSARKLYSGPYYKLSEVTDNSHNARFQGYSGLMFGGDPLPSYHHYQTLQEIVDASLMNQYAATYQNAMQMLSKPKPAAVASADEPSVSRAYGMKI